MKHEKVHGIYKRLTLNQEVSPTLVRYFDYTLTNFSLNASLCVSYTQVGNRIFVKVNFVQFVCRCDILIPPTGVHSVHEVRAAGGRNQSCARSLQGGAGGRENHSPRLRRCGTDGIFL